MNKARRNELAELKRKKRIKLYRASPNEKWTHKLKNHATLCSCSLCADQSKKYKLTKYKLDASEDVEIWHPDYEKAHDIIVDRMFEF